jgi:predicted nucleic acid-binding protein
MPVKHSLTAASALQHQLTIVTRNVSDFQNAGVLFNPFSAL